MRTITTYRKSGRLFILRVMGIFRLLSKAIPKLAYGRCTQGATSVLLLSEPNPTIPWWFHEPSDVFNLRLPAPGRFFPRGPLISVRPVLPPPKKPRPGG